MEYKVLHLTAAIQLIINTKEIGMCKLSGFVEEVTQCFVINLTDDTLMTAMKLTWRE
jgi:hypothetical protein